MIAEILPTAVAELGEALVASGDAPYLRRGDDLQLHVTARALAWFRGYSRVSTRGQHLDLQVNALEEVNCELIYSDMLSGARDDRPELARCLDDLGMRRDVGQWDVG